VSAVDASSTIYECSSVGHLSIVVQRDEWSPSLLELLGEMSSVQPRIATSKRARDDGDRDASQKFNLWAKSLGPGIRLQDQCSATA
jgi:hypothetical protein